MLLGSDLLVGNWVASIKNGLIIWLNKEDSSSKELSK